VDSFDFAGSSAHVCTKSDTALRNEAISAASASLRISHSDDSFDVYCSSLLRSVHLLRTVVVGLAGQWLRELSLNAALIKPLFTQQRQLTMPAVHRASVYDPDFGSCCTSSMPSVDLAAAAQLHSAMVSSAPAISPASAPVFPEAPFVRIALNKGHVTPAVATKPSQDELRRLHERIAELEASQNSLQTRLQDTEGQLKSSQKRERDAEAELASLKCARTDCGAQATPYTRDAAVGTTSRDPMHCLRLRLGLEQSQSLTDVKAYATQAMIAERKRSDFLAARSPVTASRFDALSAGVQKGLLGAVMLLLAASNQFVHGRSAESGDQGGAYTRAIGAAASK
jgi:TolA-binding protein